MTTIHSTNQLSRYAPRATRRERRLRNVATAAPAMGLPLDSPTDPRWVLAARAAEQLEGEILRPEPRERLVRLGVVLGLSLFDANLIIAIVQDQARRGFAAQYCPLAAEPRLRLIPLHGEPTTSPMARKRRALRLAWGLALLIGAELAVLSWLMGL